MIPSTLSPKEQQALDDYMAKKLPQYELLNTYPKSNHPYLRSMDLLEHKDRKSEPWTLQPIGQSILHVCSYSQLL